jgi:ankyrin repeat protein
MAATGAGALHSWHTRGLYVKAALLSEAFNLTSHVKLRVSDHYVKHGVMPHDNADAHLPPPKSIYGTSVKRVAINRGGVLIVDFDEQIGTQSMTFTPTVSPVSGLLSWNCTSDSIDVPILEKLKPNCSYMPITLESRLMKAIANKDLPLVEKQLVDGAQLEAVVNGNTPLMLAARIGELSIVDRLLESGAHVDNAALNSERRTPLMVAITSNHSEVVALLLSNGGSITRKDYRGLTAMDHAIATDRRLGGERFVLMISARFNPQFAGIPTEKNVDEVSEIERDLQLQSLYGEYRRAARACHVQRLTSLMLSEKDLQSPEIVQGKPLGWHIKKPQCKVALIDHLSDKKSYQSALHAHLAEAVHNCNIKQIESALNGNPNVDVHQVYRGLSHLNRAVSAGCAAVVRLMVRKKGLKNELVDDILVSAIQQAPQQSLVTLVSNLLAAGANVNGRDAGGQTPLSAAIALEQPVVAKYLVDAGANVNAPTLNKSYPVIEATKKGYEHLVMQMVAKGAELNATDSLGRTALLAAVGRSRHRLVDSLIRAGANTHVTDSNGINAVLLAESRNLRQIKTLLTASSE